MGAAESQPAEDEKEVEERRARNISRMDARLRQKMNKGVRYNMKVVVRGSRGVGKTALWRRLQGLPFDDGYDATREIKTATIHWAPRDAPEPVRGPARGNQTPSRRAASRGPSVTASKMRSVKRAWS